MKKLAIVATGALMALAVGTAPAQAAHIAVGEFVEGNDCPGAFGASFGECVLAIGDALTPVIAKFEIGAGGVVGTPEINIGLFPTVDGSEWMFDFDITEGEVRSGSWMYTPGTGDPVVTYYSLKYGPGFEVRDAADDEFEISQGLSHIVFYDTNGGEDGDTDGGTDGDTDGDVPEPVSMVLVGAGLLGASLARRRK